MTEYDYLTYHEIHSVLQFLQPFGRVLVFHYPETHAPKIILGSHFPPGPDITVTVLTAKYGAPT